MGHHGDNAANLRLWQIARDFTLCDNFFMGAFAGSLFVAVLNGLVILSIGLALGVPLAPIAGVWSMLTNFIPQIGGYLRCSFFVLLALPHGTLQAALPGGIFHAYKKSVTKDIHPDIFQSRLITRKVAG